MPTFEIKDKDLAARIGKLSVNGKTIETPAFFPVVNPFKKGHERIIQKIKEIGFEQVITNSFIIKQRLGDRIPPGGVHGIVGFDNVVMTDSGAYQLLIYGGGRIRIDPMEIVEYQKRLGSDIAVIADIPTKDTAPYEEALMSVEETIKRAEFTDKLIEGDERVWVLPIQGGVYYDLVRRSAEAAWKFRNYSMYAIGSPVTVMEKYEMWKVAEMVATAKTILPLDKPVHLFGGGHPMIIPIMVALGIDSFDSASYILYAREGRYMTEHGTYRIEDLDYLPCECEVCSRYTPRELMEMPRDEREYLLAVHNLHVIMREIKRVKTAIREGRLWELVEERARTHPAMRESLNVIIKYRRFIEKLDPRFRGDAHGIFLYDATSYYRPELMRHRRYLKRVTARTARGRLVLVPGSPQEKPFSESRVFASVRRLLGIGEDDTVMFYLPFYELVPLGTDYAYPYMQFEMPVNPPKEVVVRLVKRLNAAIRRWGGAVVVTCSEYGWSSREFLERALRVDGVRFVEVCAQGHM